MRDYAKVSPHFWVGKTGKQLKKDPNGLMVALYLMTNPHANMLGLYYIPVMYIAHETGLDFEGASKGLNSACEAGFCTYDYETEVVWVYEMARFQVADELKPADNRCKGVQKDYDSLPENPFLSAFYDKYSIPFCMLSKRGDSTGNTSPSEAPYKPLRSQEQEQEQEQEQLNSGSSSAHEQKKPHAPIQFSQYQSEDHKRYTLLACANQYPIQNDFIELAQNRFENIPTQDLNTMFSGGGMFCDFFSARGNQSENTASLWLVKWFTWIENNKDQIKRNREKQNQVAKQQATPDEPSYFEKIFADQQAASEITVSSVEIPLLGVLGNA